MQLKNVFFWADDSGASYWKSLAYVSDRSLMRVKDARGLLSINIHSLLSYCSLNNVQLLLEFIYISRLVFLFSEFFFYDIRNDVNKHDSYNSVATWKRFIYRLASTFQIGSCYMNDVDLYKKYLNWYFTITMSDLSFKWGYIQPNQQQTTAEKRTTTTNGNIIAEMMNFCV